MIKKQKWIHYKRKAKFIELNIKDHQNQSIDFYKLEKGKTRDIKRILKKLRNNYDFDLVNPKEKVKNNKNFLKKDIGW